MDVSGHVCYVCHEEEMEGRTFLAQGEQCPCRGSNVIHIECFENMVRAGHDQCSVCRQRWAFLPAEKGRTRELHGHVIEETWHEKDGRWHGGYVSRMDGRLHMEATYVHGILEGWMKVYCWKTGLLKRMVFYEDGRKNYVGIFYRGGRTRSNVRFYKGIRHGETLYYKNDGSYGRVALYYYGSLVRNL
jgi:hypothetical protein